MALIILKNILSSMMAFFMCFTTLFGSVGPKNFVRNGWLLADIPAYDGGVLSEDLYNCGAGLADDSQGKTGEDSFMQIASYSNSLEFKRYLAKLEYFGYKELAFRNIGLSGFAQYQKGDVLIYAGFNFRTKETRIIEDKSSVPVTDFDYSYIPAEGDTTEVFQYGLYYTGSSDAEGLSADNGMLYVVKLADNSVIIIDSGARRQATEKSVAGFMSFLRNITGIPEGGTVRVACWYCTHAHGDHTVFFSKLIRVYNTSLSVERAMFNFPSASVLTGSVPDTAMVRSRLVQYYPGIKFVKPHTGQLFNLADVTLEVLYTHEDNVNPIKAKTNITTFNDSTTIVKISFCGKTFLVLGDADNLAENVLCTNISASVLKSDIVQAAHHCFNDVYKIYRRARADVVLIPQASKRTLERNRKIYDVIARYTDESNIFFAGTDTTGISVEGDKFVIEHQPLVGSVYDGSPMSSEPPTPD